MKFLHPVFMLILLSFLYKIYKTGTAALQVNEKSPEADLRAQYLEEHKKWAKIVTILMVGGFIFGVIGMVYFFKVNEIFLKSYGHGFIGAGILGLMLSNMFVGSSVKKPARPKQRENLLSFHKGLMYFVIIGSIFSVLTGAAILISGPSA
ncbi:MAG: hypothetical protein PWR01_3325 [Clostridiales bacterium]|jgi:uncharacterized membrane protein|nr:hypothetical protein [Clostridiales bacterium]MDN5282252.1 hypothetical protein [Candidatus Ozemobacter sp.]